MSLVPVSEMHGAFSNRDLPSTSREYLWATAIAVCFESFLDSCDQQFKKGLHMFDINVFARWSLTLGGSTISPEDKISLKIYTYVSLLLYSYINKLLYNIITYCITQTA